MRLRKYVAELPLRCPHNVNSGSGCWRCGDVVPTLQGYRPWWAPLWRLFHVNGTHLLCKVGLHKWTVIRYGTYDNLCQCVRCEIADIR